MPNLERVGDYFLINNTVLTEAEFLNLKKVGPDFLSCCNNLAKLKAPKAPKLTKEFKDIIESNSETKEDIKTEEAKDLEESKWMNRFGNWYGTIDRVSQSAKNRFIQIKSNIVKTIREKIKGRDNSKQEENEDIHEQ